MGKEKNFGVKGNRKLPIRLSIDLTKVKTQENIGTSNGKTIFQVESDEFALEFKFDEMTLFLWSSFLNDELPEDLRERYMEKI